MDDDALRSLLGGVRRIAIVGASPRPDRPSSAVLARLVARGYGVVPVAPGVERIAGLDVAASLAELDGPVDLVDVFRRPEAAEDVTAQAIAIGAPVVWLQVGIRSDGARARALAAGIAYVEDRCLAVEVERLGLGPDASR